MDARIIIRDMDSGYEEISDIRDIGDPCRFSYLDKKNARCFLEISEEGLSIVREASDHSSELHIKEDGYLKITAPEGSLTFSLKVLEIRKNNDIITLVYSIDNVTRSIVIEYIGV